MISDPNILVSMINMKLRDGDYSSLDDACLSLGIDKEELERRLAAAGFHYDSTQRQFK
ncbi:MAG: DUF4250 domain-containing protein [Muribaculaceae bacterium]|jgi:hypothetical protein